MDPSDRKGVKLLIGTCWFLRNSRWAFCLINRPAMNAIEKLTTRKSVVKIALAFRESNPVSLPIENQSLELDIVSGRNAMLSVKRGWKERGRQPITRIKGPTQPYRPNHCP